MNSGDLLERERKRNLRGGRKGTQRMIGERGQDLERRGIAGRERGFGGGEVGEVENENIETRKGRLKKRRWRVEE